MSVDSRRLARRIRESLPEQGVADSVLEARIQDVIDEELGASGNSGSQAGDK